jgi:hypothetical protein
MIYWHFEKVLAFMRFFKTVKVVTDYGKIFNISMKKLDIRIPGSPSWWFHIYFIGGGVYALIFFKTVKVVTDYGKDIQYSSVKNNI